MNPIGSLLSGGLSGGISASSAAKSGDAATGPVNIGQNFSFAQSSPFNVGSGSASGSADAGAGASPLSTPLILAGLAALLGAAWLVSRRA